MSGAEVVLTVLHAGGKFGGDGYKVSGGLHGVGVSVVNALSRSSRSRSTATASATAWTSPTAASRRPSSRSSGKAPRGPGHRHGTTVRSGPTPRSSTTVEFRAQTLLERLQMMAFLNKGLEIRFNDERPGHDPEPVVYRYAGGIVDFVRHVNASKEALFAKVGYFEPTRTTQEVEVAFQWNTGYNTDGLHSFANGINTIEGGMHEEGFKKAPHQRGQQVRPGQGPAQGEGRQPPGRGHPRGPHRHHLRAPARPAVRGPDQGQARQRLDALAGRAGHQREAGRLARGAPHRGQQDRQEGDRRRPGPRRGPQGPRRHPAQVARSRAPACPTSSRTARPSNRDECELFIVEGDSAGGSAIQARDPRTQAILPIRGKILNVERARIDKMLKNTEIQALISAIGAGLGEEFDVDKIRYDKVIILCDADVDGSHIRTLLLTFFFRQMKPLVEHGPRLHRPAAAVLHRWWARRRST